MPDALNSWQTMAGTETADLEQTAAVRKHLSKSCLKKAERAGTKDPTAD